MMDRKRWIVLVCGTSLLLGCEASEQVIDDGPQETDVVADPLDAPAADGFGDTPVVPPGDTQFDVAKPDTTTPLLGGFESPCDGNEDCLSGYCIEDGSDLGTRVCTIVCDESCPDPTWQCVIAPGTTDAVSLCLPPESGVCAPCEIDADCEEGDDCLTLGKSGEAYCGRLCTGASPCPEDYPCGFSCNGGTAACGDACVNLQSDPNHCGACGDACPASAVCSEGACAAACGGDTIECEGICVDPRYDVMNCGDCGTVCGAGEVCSDGICAAGCGGGSTKCGDACVDTTLDPAHCGVCGNACPPGEVCSASGCGLVCAGGTTKCGDTCVPLGQDPSHCGACGNACDAGKVCTEGFCALACSGGTAKCGNVCVNLSVDPAHCGECGSSCPPNQVCSQGLCGVFCGGGSSKCGSACVQLDLDPAHCGECGNACAPGQICSAGICGLSCSGGTFKCGILCVDTANDPENCGGCGNACGQGQSCAGGFCALECGGGTTKCGNVCADLTIDPQHCGACGQSCPVTQVCAEGSCEIACGPGSTQCGNACVDLLTSPDHCGDCDSACDAGQDCTQGFCSLACGAGTTKCGNVCADTGSSPDHCGACGQACGPDEACISGLCAPLGVGCGPDDTLCGAACVNTQFDSANCGGCGEICPAGELCLDGTCDVICLGGTTQCGAACVNTQSDVSHCGSCGEACGVGELCSAGSCATTGCQGASTLCSGECVDTLANPNHCGECDGACDAGTFCVQGDCVVTCAGGTTQCGELCVSIQNDPAHCGGCDLPCAQGEVCGDGACQLFCPAGLTTCGGACVDAGSNPEHCGGCNQGCTAEEACLGGTCVEVGGGGVCIPGSVELCYSGPGGTLGKGLCHTGTKTCAEDGSVFGACEGEVVPSAESCLLPGDEDCDGEANEEGDGCACNPGAIVACYSGDIDTQDVGACAAGTKVCNNQGTLYGPCEGEVLPAAEICDNGLDENCNGESDEAAGGCSCAAGATEPCYSGPGGTEGVGQCESGTKTCKGDGSGWAACLGEVTPTLENCLTPEDEDCDGDINEAEAGCGCVPDATLPCYTGLVGTEGVGACAGGQKTCQEDGVAYGSCVAEVTPVAEVCGDEVDEDCNGVNESCDGNPLWGQIFRDAAVRYTTALAVDRVPSNPSEQRFIVGGHFFGTHNIDWGTITSEGEEDIWIAYYSNYWGKKWQKRLGDGASDQLHDLHADNTSQILAVGGFEGDIDMGQTLTSLGGVDAFVARISDGGGWHWAKRFGGAGSQRARVVVTDVNQNIYVAGDFQEAIDMGAGSMASAGGTDIFVAAFSSNGTLLWQKSFGGSGNDEVRGIDLDAGGGLYLTGAFEETVDFGGENLTSAGGRDVYVARLLTSDGSHSQSKRFGDAQGQRARGLVSDGLGNIRVIGEFTGAINLGGETLVSAGGRDVFLARFGYTLTHSWSVAYGGPGDQEAAGVALDDAGSSVVGGTFAQTIDIDGAVHTSAGATDGWAAKIDAFGDALWTRRDGDDKDQSVRAIGSNIEGDAIVAGDFTGEIKWTSAPTRHHMQDTFITRLSYSNGSGISINHNGTDHSQIPERVVVDATGHVVLAGYYDQTIDLGGGLLTTAGYTPYIARYTPAGDHLWSKQFETTGTSYLKAMHADGEGNVYGAGYFDNQVDFGGATLQSAGSWDVFVFKLDSDGNHLWSERYGNSDQQGAYGLGSDPFGNVYMTGWMRSTTDFGGGALSSSGNHDIFLVKLGADGGHLWSKRFGDGSWEVGYDVSVDDLGNVVMIGSYNGNLNLGGTTHGSSSNDAFLAKYDAAGNFIWSKAYGGSSSQEGLAVHAKGSDIIIAGDFHDNINLGCGNHGSSNWDIYVARLNYSGTCIWSKDFGEGDDQRVGDVKIDDAGNVILAGHYQGNLKFGGGDTLTGHGSYWRGYLAKLGTEGEYIWARSLGDNSSHQYTRSVAIDTTGNVYATGDFGSSIDMGLGQVNSAGSQDTFFAKYSP
jgi:hypothetical protein